MRKEQVTCDVCGAQKQETNHWFIITFIPKDPEDPSVVVSSCAWSASGRIYFDVCGEACVLKKVSELISKQ